MLNCLRPELDGRACHFVAARACKARAVRAAAEPKSEDHQAEKRLHCVPRAHDVPRAGAYSRLAGARQPGLDMGRYAVNSCVHLLHLSLERALISPSNVVREAVPRHQASTCCAQSKLLLGPLPPTAHKRTSAHTRLRTEARRRGRMARLRGAYAAEMSS